MWEALREIAREREMGLNQLVTEVDERRNGLGLTAAIRVYIVDFYRQAAGLDATRGHTPRRMPA